MKTLDNDIIRKEFGIGKNVPIYHTCHETIVAVKDSKNGVDAIEKVLDDPSGSMPFDVMVVSEHVEKGEYEYFLVVYFNSNSCTVNRIFRSDSRVVSREDYTMTEGATKEWEDSMLVYISMLFAYKKTRIILAETVVERKNKKGKTKRVPQKVTYLSFDDLTVRTPRNSNTFKEVASYLSHKVAGHWAYFKEGSRMENGHDRYGNDIRGKTWKRPYTKGEGLEIMETIRIWR